jgi:hypothetical protein
VPAVWRNAAIGARLFIGDCVVFPSVYDAVRVKGKQTRLFTLDGQEATRGCSARNDQATERAILKGTAPRLTSTRAGFCSPDT